MKLNALLMCREHQAVRVLAREFGELEIDERIRSSAEQAMEMLALGYYSALVLDFTPPGASQLASTAAVRGRSPSTPRVNGRAAWR